MRYPTLPMTIAALIAAAAGCAPAAPVADNVNVSEIAGRTAGDPTRCVLIIQGEALRLAEGQRLTLVYGRGQTIWVNRLGGTCAGLERDYSLIVDPIGAHYCRGDRVRSIDPVSRVPGATCFLGDFIPYTR